MDDQWAHDVEQRDFLTEILEAEANAREAATDTLDRAVVSVDESTLVQLAAEALTRKEAKAVRQAWIAGLEPEAHRALYPVATRFADLGLDLFGTHDLSLAVQRVVHAAARILDGVDFASLTVATSAGFATPAYSDSAAIELDQAQYENGEGPCVDATRAPGVGVTFCRDLANENPWPVFAAVAVQAGVRSVLSVGLFPTGEAPRLGALNFYARTPGALDSADHDIAVILAAYAGTALASVSALETADQHAEHLHQALETRDVIGQAKGILMQRRGLDAEAAFRVLSEASQRLNVKVRDLAQNIAASPNQQLPK